MALCEKVSVLIQRGDGTGKLLALNSCYASKLPPTPPGFMATIVNRPSENGQPVDDAGLRARYALRNGILVKVS